MDEDYNDSQDSMPEAELGNPSETSDGDAPKDISEGGGNFEDYYDDEDGGGGFRGGRGGRGNFRGRGRGPPPGWMNGPPPMRFRGRGYGPGGPPMRGGRGFFRGRGGPRFNNSGPNFDNNWGPMGPPPPMMGGPNFGPPPMMGPGGPMGPPPNMMGQPPPFGGPPGMPPPNMPQPEIWVETKSDEGKSYFYHSRTRETTWTRPVESPTCKIITQAEMESSVATGQMPGMGPQMSGPMGMGGPMGGMGPMGPMGPMGGPPPMGMMPPGMGPPGGAPPGPFSQPPPWVNSGKDAIKENQEMSSPNDNEVSPPGDSAPTLSQPPNGNMPGFPSKINAPTTLGAANGMGAPPGMANAPPGMTGPPGMGGGPPGMGGGPPGMGGGPPGMGGGPPGMGGPQGGPGGWGGWGAGWPPPLLGQPPPDLSAGASMLGQPSSLKKDLDSGKTAKDDPMVPPELAAAAAEWTTHRAPDGRDYYYHAVRQQSVWEKPPPLKHLEEFHAKMAAEKDGIKMDIDGKQDVDPKEFMEAQMAAEKERLDRERAERERAERDRQERERAEREKAEREKAEKEKAEKEKAQDKSLPVNVTPISGTPWCVVWTGDGQVFYYNPTARASVWERPEALVGRADVDKAVATPPDALKDQKAKEPAAPAAANPGANGELKRPADSDSDSEPEPPKKAKEEVPPKKAAGVGGVSGVGAVGAVGAAGVVGQIDMGRDAAIGAEMRAAVERAKLPFSTRLDTFVQMLRDRQVSAFSTWEKELQKIVFDSRYLLLNYKERKEVFDKFVRERAEEERKEKKSRLQQKRTAFRDLLDEARLHSKSSYVDFASKYGKDERFKGVEKPRDREACFNEHLVALRQKEKEEKEKKREQTKAAFMAMLKETGVDRHARWADVKKRLDGDARYKAVDSSSLKEHYFQDYCRLLKEERRRDKDKDRDRSSSKKDKKDKEREKDRDKEKDKERDKDRDKDKDRKDKDKKDKDKDKDKSSDTEPPHPEDQEQSTSSDEAKEREARAAASLLERKREVERALAPSMRDRDKEREYHKRDEAQQHLNALLADLVRDPELSWRAARRQLKKDHRWPLAELLSKEDKERLFTQHTSNLAAKRRNKLRQLFDELSLAPDAAWRDVRRKLRTEPRAQAFSDTEKMEREFKDYQRDRASSAKAALRELLLESRTLSHKSYAAVQAAPEAFTALRDTLKHDARYLNLEHIPEERDCIILAHLEELQKKGPPPPPTASEPARRAK